MLIEHNTISYAGHELIDMHGGAPTIRYNKLGPNPKHYGIAMEAGMGITIDGSSPQITNNSITGCGIFGINFISPGSPTIKDNEFTGNGQNISNAGRDISNQYPSNKF